MIYKFDIAPDGPLSFFWDKDVPCEKHDFNPKCIPITEGNNPIIIFVHDKDGKKYPI